MVDRSAAERAEVLDGLIRRSTEAVNRGDLGTARALAQEVLAQDAGNLDAASLLATERQPHGEVRRISVMFCDLVGSTALSGRLDPELYRSILSRYRRLATEIIEERHGGHLASVKGDGLLALFGYPAIHGNDTERAVTDEFSFWEPQNIASFAMLDFFAGDFGVAHRELERSIVALDATEGYDTAAVQAWYITTHPTVAMRVHLGVSRFTQGDTVGADEEVARAIELARGLEFPQGPVSECYCHWLAIWMYLERQDWDAATAAGERMQAVAAPYGIDSWNLMGMMFPPAISGARALYEGQVPGLVELQGLSMLLSGWEMAEIHVLSTPFVTLLGALHERNGDRQAARERYQASLDLARRTSSFVADAETLRRIAQLEDDVASRRAGLAEALALARRQEARHYELRIALDLHDLRGDAALTDLRTAAAGFLPTSSYPELDEARRRIDRAG